ncbi:MAG: DUF4040 domain-containing protein [Candidatus Aenigmarchaeota archaeon]|nr:DUF4040 domain-containing protein [Candidatus Aenigmarchaeota archaeon]
MILLTIFSIPIILFSLLAALSKDLLRAVVFLAVSSMCIALAFLLLKAPDIAMTEASVNACLTTLIYVIAVRKTRRYEE